MHEVCDVLEELVRNGTLRNYALGGATAAGFHGEPITTRDVDVFVFVEARPGEILISLEPLLMKLRAMGFDTFEEEGLLIHNYPVRFLSCAPGLETEAVEQAVTASWEKHSLRVMRPEHLAAIALTAGRPKDRASLVYLVELPNFDLERFREILRRFNLLPIWQQWSVALGLAP